MKFKTPLLYNKDGKLIGWIESEIPVELIAQLRWNWAHSVKNFKVEYRTPIFEDNEKE